MSDVVRYFDEAAPGWAQRYTDSRHFKTRLATALSWLCRRPSGNRMLDFGCGAGVLVAELAARGYAVTGVDTSSKMLDAARNNLSLLQTQAADRRDLVESAILRLELIGEGGEGRYQESSYDAVIGLGVLEYVDDPIRLATQLAGLVAPGGSMIVSFPNQTSWTRRLESFVHAHPALFRRVGLFRHLTGPHSYMNFQKVQFHLSELDQSLGRLGLPRVRVRYHVAPQFLGKTENHPRVGMTIIAEYARTGLAPPVPRGQEMP